MRLPSALYDLSQPVFSNCPQYPDRNPRPVQIRSLYLAAVQGVNKEIVEMSTHSGTHCDAPHHFFGNGSTIDRIPLQKYIAPAIVLDVRGKSPGSALEVADLERFGDSIAAGDVALLNTGWGHKRANTREFLMDYVYLGESGAQFLLGRNIAGVGIDAVSLGGYDDPAKAAPPHRILLGADKFIVEELCFPDEVMDGRKRLFVAVPIKLQGCGGAWTRAMLWEF